MPETFSQHVIKLRTRFSEMAQKIMTNERTALIRREANDQGRKAPDIKVGDMVYYYCKRQDPTLSRKLTSPWKGPFQVRRIVSDSLLLLYPAGRWAANPRELIATFSRVRKVDKIQPLSILQPSRRELVDMSDFEDASTAEVIAFEEALQRDHRGRYVAPDVPQPSGEQIEEQMNREIRLDQEPAEPDIRGRGAHPRMPRDQFAWENLQEEVDPLAPTLQETTGATAPQNSPLENETEGWESRDPTLPNQGQSVERGDVPPPELAIPARATSFRGAFKSEGATPRPEVRFADREIMRPSARVEGTVRGGRVPPRIPGAGQSRGRGGTGTPLTRPDRPVRTAAEHARDLISDLANPDRRRTAWHSRKN